MCLLASFVESHPNRKRCYRCLTLGCLTLQVIAVQMIVVQLIVVQLIVMQLILVRVVACVSHWVKTASPTPFVMRCVHAVRRRISHVMSTASNASKRSFLQNQAGTKRGKTSCKPHET